MVEILSQAQTGLVPSEMEPLEQRDQRLEALWRQLEDVPMDPDTECLEDGYLHFPPGTHREDIWRWFDARHSKGVAHLLLQDSVDRTSEIAHLYTLQSRCFECESRACAFNCDGECRFAMVNGRTPKMTERDGCVESVLSDPFPSAVLPIPDPPTVPDAVPVESHKLVTLHIGFQYARTIQVPSGMTAKEISKCVDEICADAKAAGCQTLLTELPSIAFSAKGLIPYGLEDIHVRQRDFREEAMGAAGIGMANCWTCNRLIDPCFCERYESDIDETDPSSHGNQDCCQNNMVYQVLYGDDPTAVEYFLLKDEGLLDDEPALLYILMTFFPAVKAMVERPDFVLSKVQIRAAQTGR